MNQNDTIKHGGIRMKVEEELILKKSVNLVLNGKIKEYDKLKNGDVLDKLMANLVIAEIQDIQRELQL